MPTSQNFRAAQAQASVFTPGLHFQSAKVLGHLLQNYIDRFTGQPLTLPVPADAPAVLPRLILQSEDSRYRLQVSPARLDVFWARQAAGDDLDLPAFLTWVTALVLDYRQFTRAGFGRLACLLTRVAPDENPASTLVQHFCQERWLQPGGPLDQPNDFELHAHRRFRLGNEFESNSWMRCKTGTLQQVDSPLAQPVIVVEQDFNTLAEELETRDYSTDEIRTFYQLAPLELDEVLRRYFPDEPNNA